MQDGIIIETAEEEPVQKEPVQEEPAVEVPAYEGILHSSCKLNIAYGINISFRARPFHF